MNIERIIIADPELLYAIKLQIKFMKEMGDYYEIDIITDQVYFDEYFSIPRDTVCLIVNEEWITQAISRQNIDVIVSLTNKTYSEDLTQIYRPSSTDEIFNKIRSLLRSYNGTASAASRQAKVVIFHSTSGGVGKTTLAMGLAEYLTSKFYRVLYINTETVQSYQYYLQDRQSISSEMTMNLISEPENVYGVLKKAIRKERFNYLPPFAMPLFSYGINENTYSKLIIGARDSKEYDYIIVDGDSNFSMEKAEQISIADNVFLVFQPTEQSRYALKMFLNQVRGNTGKFMIVCNCVGAFPVSDLLESSTTRITECVSKYRKDIDADTLHGFAMTPDIRKLAILIE